MEKFLEYAQKRQLFLVTVDLAAFECELFSACVALENADPDGIVTVSSRAASMPEVKLHIREGERYRLLDLLYSLILESHNDTAVAIAEHIGGSVEQFASMMNQKARDLGCFDTYFITPNGLDAQDEHGIHSTTAKDLPSAPRKSTVT